LLFFTILILYACTNNGASKKVAAADTAGGTIHAIATDTIQRGAKPIVLAGCYQMILKKDTATLQLQLKDSTVTGHLRYKGYEKDDNTGTIKGVLRKELILADYTFQSEGVTSVREVIFKIKGDTLVQAYGDLAEVDNKMVFTNKNNLQFGPEQSFLKVTCL
jgi:hypothetical protein